ncbi:MAG: fasciclin domain-containing protein [Anaerolineales bacterium]
MKGKTFLYVLLAVVLLVSACAAPATEEVPTEAPQPTATPMPEPTEEPTPEPTPEPVDIVDAAIADGRFTTLVAAVQAAGLVDALKAEGPLTVFAPTDDAFAALPEGTVDALLNDIPSLTDILLYHVVDGKVMAKDVVELTQAQTLQGQFVDIKVEDGNVFIDDAQVIITDIETANGVIHVIDAVIQPETRDIVDVAAEDERFSTLVAAVQAAGLVDALKAEGPLTVFAPTDDAFAALPEGTVDALLNDIPTLTDILLYHVVDGKVMAKDVVELTQAQTLQGQFVDIKVEDGNVFIDDAQVIITDIETANGVIHVIDAVIQPETRDIVDVASEDGRFSTLVTAVQAAGLVDVLKAEGPLTVFAPTDDAFAALPEDTLNTLLGHNTPALADILLYHVVDGKVMAKDVIELSEAETLLGQNVSISVMDGKVMVNDAEVIITDLETSNGVIHVIDAVLIP